MMETLNTICRWFWTGAGAVACGMVAGMWFIAPVEETAYSREQADAMNAFVAAKTIPMKDRIVRPKTEAERNKLIASVFNAGRE